MLPREGFCQGGDVLTEVLRAQGAGYGAHAGAGCERAAGADAGWVRGATCAEVTPCFLYEW